MKNILIVLLCANLLSCENPMAARNNNDKEIILPREGEWVFHQKDTTFNINAEAPKIVVYFNKDGCTSCRFRELAYWRSLIYELQKMPADCDTSRVEFVFIFAAGDNKEQLKDALENYNFPW